MQHTLGWLITILPGFLYLAQLISSINFKTAQQLGLQEDPNHSDPLLQRAERYTAYWDLLSLIWLPMAGVLMVINHQYWPILALLGSAIYLDAAGREVAKMFSFKHEKLRMGTDKQQAAFFISYLVMAALAILIISYTLSQLGNDFPGLLAN